MIVEKITSFIAIVLVCVFVLSSCGASDNNGTNADTTDTTATEDTSDTTTTQGTDEKYPSMDMTQEMLTPYITLGDYKSLVVELNVYVDDETVDKEIANIAKEYGYYTEITGRKTQKGDKLCVDFKGYVDGEAFEGGTANDSYVDLVENNGFIEGFDADLYGIEVGTTVSTNVTFPEDYHAKDLAGVDAVFEITVNAIIDEFKFTDESIKEYTSESFLTVAEYREYYRELMIIENMDSYDAALSNKICDEIHKISEIKLLPEDQYDMYKKVLADNYKATYEYYAAYYYNYGITSYEQYAAAMGITEEFISNEAKLWLVEDLIVISCGKDLGIELSDDEFYSELEELCEEWGFDSVDDVIKSYSEAYMRNILYKEESIPAIKEAVTVVSDYDDYKHLYDKHR